MSVAPAGLSPGTAPIITTATGTPVAAWATASRTRTAALPSITFLGFFDGPAFEYGLSRKSDFSHGINAGHHDGNLIA